MLDIPGDKFHAHLFGGGGDHRISDAQGVAFAEFHQVFACLIGDFQVSVNGSQNIKKGSDGFIFPLSGAGEDFNSADDGDEKRGAVIDFPLDLVQGALLFSQVVDQDIAVDQQCLGHQPFIPSNRDCHSPRNRFT
ncbi:MAG: hypothetical protein NTW71_11855 [Deltaproteobacteria bacterium]|nr:hypothetical protein [Deltaproteobacteria bacterium]